MDIFWNVMFFVFFLLTIVILWFMLYDSNRFVVNRYEIKDKKIKKKLRIVFVSDLHNKQYGSKNERLMKAIWECHPDYCLIGGDLINAIPGKKRTVALEFLEGIKDIPIIYAYGNHEHRLALYPETYGDADLEYADELEGLGIKRYKNEKVTLNENNVTIYTSLIDREYYKRFGIKPMKQEYLEELLADKDEESYGVLLAHNPDYFEQYAGWGADLVLSGHVHGGIVRVPFWNKGVLSPNIRFFPRYDGGMFKKEKSTMILSCGLGMHTIPFRLFNPGELVCVELCPGEEEPDRERNGEEKCL